MAVARASTSGLSSARSMTETSGSTSVPDTVDAKRRVVLRVVKRIVDARVVEAAVVSSE